MPEEMTESQKNLQERYIDIFQKLYDMVERDFKRSPHKKMVHARIEEASMFVNKAIRDQ